MVGTRRFCRAQHQRLVVLLDHVAYVGQMAVGQRGHIRVGEVLPSAEGAPGTAQHEHARGLVGLDVIEGVTQLSVHLAGEAVELVGAVQRQAGDAVGDLEMDVLVLHSTLPNSCRNRGEPVQAGARSAAALGYGE
jgi:hypothetical protein